MLNTRVNVMLLMLKIFSIFAILVFGEVFFMVLRFSLMTLSGELEMGDDILFGLTIGLVDIMLLLIYFGKCCS